MEEERDEVLRQEEIKREEKVLKKNTMFMNGFSFDKRKTELLLDSCPHCGHKSNGTKLYVCYSCDNILCSRCSYRDPIAGSGCEVKSCTTRPSFSNSKNHIGFIDN